MQCVLWLYRLFSLAKMRYLLITDCKQINLFYLGMYLKYWTDDWIYVLLYAVFGIFNDNLCWIFSFVLLFFIIMFCFVFWFVLLSCIFVFLLNLNWIEKKIKVTLICVGLSTALSAERKCYRHGKRCCIMWRHSSSWGEIGYRYCTCIIQERWDEK